ncbi:MAG TPA: radical SAM protein [Acidothermaceae bacterium]|nr:radical SAM protein [Acidothermaceae bacterium]
MRIAVCGGPYANPYALSAFVADARSRGCEKLYCLGDLGGFGAELDALWPILTEANITCIAGNYDVAIARADPDCGCGYRDLRDNAYAQLIYDHTLANTSRVFASWMGHLPTQRRENLAGCDVHFVHGSPLALNDFWWESLSDEEHESRAGVSGADVICCTHSGLPWIRRIAGSLVVNVGVLGKPANDGSRNVWYAILDLAAAGAKATLVPLDYDWAAQAASMRASGLPEAFVETIETGWWTTCLEVLPPRERAAGRYQLYRSALPTRFAPLAGGWGNAEQPIEPDEKRPVVPLFGSAYFPARLWVYTNFHCNLACDYCAVASSPKTAARALTLSAFRDIVDQAVTEGFEEIYLTGGEPLMHPDIADLLAYATAALPTVLLTNAMLLNRARLDRFASVARNAGDRLVVQTSLDGARAATHDAHRGAGSFKRTLDGIQALTTLGVRTRVALTETTENSAEIPAVHALLTELGITNDDFAVRPLLRRGFSADGLDIGEHTTVPELTVSADGLHWHPAGADATTSPDMLLTRDNSSLAIGKQLVAERFFTARLFDGTLPAAYRCAV